MEGEPQRRRALAHELELGVRSGPQPVIDAGHLQRQPEAIRAAPTARAGGPSNRVLPTPRRSPDPRGRQDRGRRWCGESQTTWVYMSAYMANPLRGRPDNVIALSPFRAELGRARRLRRADTLYEAADVGAAVRALPGDELYYVLNEIGLGEGRDLLAFATAEQLQIVLDFALWRRDRIGERELGEWLEALSTAPIESIGRWFMGLDSELVGLILRRGARIYDLSLEEPPEEPEGTFFPTPDRLFVLDVLGEPAGEPAAGGDDRPDRAAVIDPALRRALPGGQRLRAADPGRGPRGAGRRARGERLPLAPGAHGRPRLFRLLRGPRGLPRARSGERAPRRRILPARPRGGRACRRQAP